MAFIVYHEPKPKIFICEHFCHGIIYDTTSTYSIRLPTSDLISRGLKIRLLGRLCFLNLVPSSNAKMSYP